MTIQDLGSLGELIAAIATVATLLYLAVQIRHQARATNAEATQASHGADAANIAVAQDPELARIFNMGLADFDALDSVERTRFVFILSTIIGSTARIYDAYVKFGVMDEVQFKEHHRGPLGLLETPGGSQFWHEFGGSQPVEFCRFVETHVNLRSVAGKATRPPAAQQGAAADSAELTSSTRAF